MKFLLQFPTYKRPEKFLRALGLYLELSSGTNKLFFNINCDLSDEFMKSEEMYQKIRRAFEEYPYAEFNLSLTDNTTKVSAINDMCGASCFDFDVVMCLSDDMIPQQFFWDLKISKAMKKYFPDLDGALHFNDGYQGDNLITLSIMGKKLYDYFGYIYHPDYKSLYCDNEFTDEVYRLGKVKYINDVIIKHEHYGEKNNSNSGQFDEAAEKTLRFSARDSVVYIERKRGGFPKERITND